jgi:glutamate synthase (NADPH) large chain
VLLERVTNNDDEAEVRDLIEKHVQITHSTHAKSLLANWGTTVSKFWKVIPRATLILAVAEPEEVEAKGAAD